MYEVCREHFFSAAHQLRGYEGKCESLHGHNWRVRVYVRSHGLDTHGMVVDFKQLKKVMDGILDRLDHHMLNDVPPFDELNPSAENLARHIAEEVDTRISDDRVQVHRCDVWESDRSLATYYLPA